MHAGRTIADSDDEEELSPIPSPVRTGPWLGEASGGTASSDPGFFRAAYISQQETAVVEDAGANGHEPSDEHRDGEELAPPGRDAVDEHADPWALMSSPDALQNAPQAKNTTRSRVAKTYSKKAIPADNSQPSPRNASGMATSKSGNATPSKALRTYSKRAPEVNSSATPPVDTIDLVSPKRSTASRTVVKVTKRDICDDEDISTRPAKRRKKISELRVRGAGGLEEGAIDLASSFDISGNTSASMAPPARQSAQGGGSSGEVRKLYVEPSRMTASQMREYEEVSLPFLSSIDEPRNLGQYTNLARSSGSETIAYPTPTPYRRHYSPSMPPTQQDPASAEPRSSGKGGLSSLPPTAESPSSSPDVVSAAPGEKKAELTAATELSIVEDVELPVVEDRDNSCDEDWNEAEFGFPQEQRQLRTRRKLNPKKQTARIEIPDDITEAAEPMNVAELPEKVDARPVPKKRGRKRKDMLPDPEPVASTVAETARIKDEPPPKRRRGRPKKRDEEGAADDASTQGAHLPKPGDGKETSHDVQDGSEGAGCVGTDAKQDDELDTKEDHGGVDATEVRERDADDDVSRRRRTPAGTKQGAVGTSAAGQSSVPRAGDGGGAAGDGKGGGPAAEGGQGVATRGVETAGRVAGGLQMQVARPMYRVGLSKRTRIAPLLKIIRKS